ncbi:DUF4236 domain-containing protein [Hoyosella sp. G463]|uniref:DUF4236 domain-containing protein n=1 Tax=Lolliginicoccus lacisalsi TaxID=2742202 RepID=A0A927JBF3_9ACTN|nr:DUF4236 domain-containing protein [Lolliginicoccus lacisalsi]MBD8506171.1 DUF4236 domain-containing protein [Lolliginicoccus lacisalsi]
MGFYIRKSVKAGPFRFNLSKSGIGVSSGVPGFRLGRGPRGNYVHAGRHGAYYRKSLGGSGTRSGSGSGTRSGRRGTGRARARQGTPTTGGVPGPSLRDATGVEPLHLEPTGGGDLVDQMNEAAGRRAWFWPSVALFALVGLVTMPLGLLAWLVAIPACWWLWQRDRARRTAVVMYDVEDELDEWFDALVGNWAWLTGSERIWRVVAEGAVASPGQRKSRAGATDLVRREVARASLEGPRHLTSNVVVPTLAAGSSALYFLPDRVLVRDGKHYTDVAYEHLTSTAGTTTFIEQPGTVPSDARQTGSTWQHVNKDGSPDRRFSHNTRLAVVQYDQWRARSTHGLDWRVQVSRENAARAISQTLAQRPGPA